MDPLTIIGTAGAVANIVDAISKTISALQELHKQWQDTELTMQNVTSQLQALRAALTKIQEWSETNSPDQHHQLTLDLDVILGCCRKLIARIDTSTADLQCKPNGALTTRSRIKLVLGSRKMDLVQKMLDRQTGALTLLLTACNWWV